MKHGWLIFLLTLSCGEGKKTPDPAATPTNTPTEAENKELRNEITSLKSEMEKLSASGPTTTVSDGDGWLITVRGASNTDGIKLNEQFMVRLDIDGEFHRQMHMTLHDCAGFRLLGETDESDGPDGDRLGGSKVNGRVGSFLGMGVYRVDGGTAAPAQACKLRARVILPDTGKYGTTTKEKDITIGSATTYLSEAAFKTTGGKVKLSLTTHDLRRADGYYTMFSVSMIEQGQGGGLASKYTFHPKAFVWLKRLPDNGKVVDAPLCDIGHVEDYDYVAGRCPTNHQLGPLPAGKYLVAAAQFSKGDTTHRKSAFLELEVE